MPDYRVTAVRYRHQELTAVQLGQGDGRAGDWLQEPHQTGLDEVIARIEAGDSVRALLRDGGVVVIGPALKVVTDGQGKKTLALDNLPADGLALADLERF